MAALSTTAHNPLVRAPHSPGCLLKTSAQGARASSRGSWDLDAYPLGMVDRSGSITQQRILNANMIFLPDLAGGQYPSPLNGGKIQQIRSYR